MSVLLFLVTDFAEDGTWQEVVVVM